MIGHVDSATDFSVSILEEALPFDLDGSDVAYNPNYQTQIRGLRIGSYSLLSNSGNFELLISHSKLTLRDATRANDEGTLSQIDYRLYVIADYRNTKFLSCLSDSNASNPDSASNRVRVAGDNPDVWPSGASMCSIVNQSIYVSLDDNTRGSTAATIADLKGGTYESTIYFMLKGQ
ncbi:MAG: hypothetical protein MJ057_06090 [Sphaerochaetaceae bacterium]|nr:hypothetical protein [Sphaerochaetaceae bacterium]